ncbi:hypothetical protein U1Q18_019130 [Sarracenia purpurea var. burkii]
MSTRHVLHATILINHNGADQVFIRYFDWLATARPIVELDLIPSVDGELDLESQYSSSDSSHPLQRSIIPDSSLPASKVQTQALRSSRLAPGSSLVATRTWLSARRDVVLPSSLAVVASLARSVARHRSLSLR